MINTPIARIPHDPRSEIAKQAQAPEASSSDHPSPEALAFSATMIVPATSDQSPTSSTLIVMEKRKDQQTSTSSSKAPSSSTTARRKHPASSQSHSSSFLNRQKRQRRQAAGALVTGLFSGGNKNAGNNSSSHHNSVTVGMDTSSSSSNNNKGTTKKKSTAQPRPQIQIPPRGIGPVHEPNEHDVLCGRGGRINAHPGNVRFRDIVVHRKKEYLAPTTKKLAKAHIAADIVQGIRSRQGRFLKEDSDGSWWDIGDQKAIKKVGQALREDAPDIREEIHPDEEEDNAKSMAAPAQKTPETIATIPIATAISGRGAKVITTNGSSSAQHAQQQQEQSQQPTALAYQRLTAPPASYQQIIPPANDRHMFPMGGGNRNTAISGAAAAAVGADDNPLYPPPVDVAFGRQFHVPDGKEDSMISGMSGLSNGGGAAGGTQLSGMSGISALTDPLSSLSGAERSAPFGHARPGATAQSLRGMMNHHHVRAAPPVFHTSSGRTMNTLTASDLRSIGGMSLQRSLSWQSGRDNMSWAEHSLAGGGIHENGTVMSGFSSYHPQQQQQQHPHAPQYLREEQLAAAATGIPPMHPMTGGNPPSAMGGSSLAMQMQQQQQRGAASFPLQAPHQQQQPAYPTPAQMYQGTSSSSGSGGERAALPSGGASVASMSVASASVGGASIMSDLSDNLLALDLAEPRLLDRRFESNNS